MYYKLISALFATVLLSVSFSSAVMAGYVYMTTLKKGSTTIKVYKGTPSGDAVTELNGGPKSRHHGVPVQTYINQKKRQGYK